MVALYTGYFAMPFDPLITFAEAEALGYGVTARALRTWHEQGRLEAQRVGRTWRTTAGRVQEAIERGWQSSSYTVRIAGMEPVQSPACGATSGTSNGTKGEGAASVQRAVSLATDLAQRPNLGNFLLREDAARLLAPVIPLK